MHFELLSASGIKKTSSEQKKDLWKVILKTPRTCLPEDINKRHFHLKGIQIPVLQFKRLSILVGKYVDYFCEVFEIRIKV